MSEQQPSPEEIVSESANKAKDLLGDVRRVSSGKHEGRVSDQYGLDLRTTAGLIRADSSSTEEEIRGSNYAGKEHFRENKEAYKAVAIEDANEAGHDIEFRGRHYPKTEQPTNITPDQSQAEVDDLHTPYQEGVMHGPHMPTDNPYEQTMQHAANISEAAYTISDVAEQKLTEGLDAQHKATTEAINNRDYDQLGSLAGSAIAEEHVELDREDSRTINENEPV